MRPEPVSVQLGQTASSALEFIKAKLQAFYALPARIGAARARAGQLSRTAAQLGRTDTVAVLRNADQELSVALTRQQQAGDKVSQLLVALGGALKLPGLGQLPPLWAVAQAALVAGDIAALLATVTKQEQTIAKAGQQLGTAASAAAGGAGAPLPPAGGTFKVPLWVYALVLGGGGYYLLRKRRR